MADMRVTATPATAGEKSIEVEGDYGFRCVVKTAADTPSTCQVWYGGRLIFDGVSNQALMTKQTMSVAAMFAGMQEEVESGLGSPRPADVNGRWLRDPYGKSHRLKAASYIGTGTYARSLCGLNLNASLRVLLTDEVPEEACKTCLRLSAGVPD